MLIDRAARSLMLTCLLAGIATAAVAQDMQTQDSSVYTDGYTGPMGPNVHKAFTGTPVGPDVQPGMDPGEDAYAAPPPAPMASAPRASQPGVISDPQQIRDCLCMQTRYEMLNNEVSTKQAGYSEATSKMSSLQDQITAAKGGPSSPQQIEQIRQLSEQRIETQNRLNEEYIPQLQKATATYNKAVKSFQNMCGGKSYDTEVLGRVKTGLVCQGG